MISQGLLVRKLTTKISCLLTLILFISNLCCSQHILIKNDRKTIPYKKLVTFDDYVEVTTDKREKIKIMYNDVDAYYDADDHTMQYLIPVTRYRVDGGLVMKDKITKMQFGERVVAGKITLYKTEVISGADVSGVPDAKLPKTSPTEVLYSTHITTSQYYAEKGNHFECVLFYDRGRSLNGFDVFKTFVDDDAEIAKKIEAYDFEFTEKSLVTLVKEYNVRNFEKVILSDYNSFGIIGLYCGVDLSKRAGLTIKVNDSIEYKLPANYRPYPIRLPLASPSKVCVIWDEGISCQVVMPIRFETQYYEVRRKAKNDSFVIEERNFREAEKFMQSQRK